jgi:hypothetical protein
VVETIKTAIAESQTALDRLEAALKPDLPGLLLARAALDVDKAAAKLSDHAEALAGGRAKPNGCKGS